MDENERTYWAVYEHERCLKVWSGGKLVGEIPLDEFPHVILQMARALRNDRSGEK